MYFVYCKDMRHSRFGWLSRRLGIRSKYHFWSLMCIAVEDNHNSIGSPDSQWMIWSGIVDVFDLRTDAHIGLCYTGNIENTDLKNFDKLAYESLAIEYDSGLAVGSDSTDCTRNTRNCCMPCRIALYYDLGCCSLNVDA